MVILEPVLQKFLDRYLFLSAKARSRHFLISPPTLKEILRRELGLKKVSRRWVTHWLSDDRKKLRIDARQKLLPMPGISGDHSLEGIATHHELWFQCSSYSNSMFADSTESVVPPLRYDISGVGGMLQFDVSSWSQGL
jgi:hypothetical protein